MAEPTTLDVPVEALRLDFTFQAEDLDTSDGGKRRAFKGKANSGKVIENHWFWGNFAIDMEGMKINRQDLPVLRDHLPSSIVGFTEKVEKGTKGIDVEGQLFDATADGEEVLRLLEAGMPMQMSVYVPPSKILKVREGESVKVNGNTLKGPGHVFEKSTLREVTVTALGADENTSAAVLDYGGERHRVYSLSEVQELPREDSPVTTEDRTPAVPVVTAASLREQHPSVFAEVQEDAVKAAQTAERERVSKIQENSAGIDAKLVQQAISEGWTVEKAQCSFLGYMRERKEARMGTIRDTTPESSGNDPRLADGVEEFTEGGGGDDTSASDKRRFAALPDGEKKWRQEFEEFGDGDKTAADLQHEFHGDVEMYVAYKKHPLPARMRGEV